MTETVMAAEKDGVLSLTLVRVAKRNALSLQLQAELRQKLEDAAQDPTVRVVVLSAAGTVFSAGHDFADSSKNSTREEHEAFEFVTIDLIDLMHELPQPIIGVIDGLAAAAGLELLLSCDIIVASTRATFSTPGVAKGMWCSTPMVPLSRSIPPHPAFEMLCLGDAIGAARAYQLGMVNRVVEPEGLDVCVADIVRRISVNSPAAIQLGKRAFYRQHSLPIESAWRIAAETVGINAMQPDAIEGSQAFLEGRAPQWQPLGGELGASDE